jgi:hypothetical protein
MSGVKNGRMAEENFALMPAVAPKQLNVVLHGVVAILFDYKSTPHALTVLVPQVGGHVYGAGPWTIENGLDAGVTYNLTNADPIMEMSPLPVAAPPKGTTTDVVIDRAKSLITFPLPGTELCKLTMPIPDEMLPIRPCVKIAGSPDFFVDGSIKKANYLESVTQIPLIHVLTYKKIKANSPPMLGTWPIPFDPSDGVARLHVFAEPAFPMNAFSSHVDDAISQVNKLFTPNLNLAFNASSVSVHTPPALTVPSTVKPNEQLSLDEHRAKCNNPSIFNKHRDGGKEADEEKDDPNEVFVTRVRNCMSLVVVNS